MIPWQRLFRFGIVGGLGFLTDAVLLWQLLQWGIGPFVGRLISVTLAALLTWRLNRMFAFQPSGRHQAVEGMRYGLVVAASGSLNYAIYALILLTVSSIHPVVALAVSTGTAMTFSYLGYSRFVFQPGH